MKVLAILEPFVKDLYDFIMFNGNTETEDNFFSIQYGDIYIEVDMNNSYWYFEDDGTVVFRLNDLTGVNNDECVYDNGRCNNCKLCLTEKSQS